MQFGFPEGQRKNKDEAEDLTAEEILMRFTEGNMEDLTERQRQTMIDAGYDDLLADFEKNLAAKKALERQGLSSPPWMG